MFKNKRTKILSLIMVVVFSLTFIFGVFANPNFNIYDFCMNLTSEIIGLAIALVLVESYVSAKKQERENK